MKKKKEEIKLSIEAKDFEVKSASINDDICHYSIHVKEGIAIGTHNVKGEGIVDEDLKIALSKLNVHLAIIDGVFSHKGIEIDKVNKFHNHETTQDYTVSGFKLKGEEDNLSIVLIGSKHVFNGRMDMETPKIALDNMGGYQFHKELKAATEQAILEVELYIKGKYTLIDPPEEKNSKQMTIDDGIAEVEFEDNRT